VIFSAVKTQSDNLPRARNPVKQFSMTRINAQLARQLP
jgi:hypothetical protein